MALTTRYGFANTPTPGNPVTAWTTVSAPGTSGTSTITVASAANFPSSVEFDIVVGFLETDGTLSNAARAHVLSVAGTVFTIQGTWAATHPIGESVYHELSAEGLQNSPGAMTDAGDTPYLGSDGRMKRLGIGGAGQLLYVSGGVPAWSGTMFTWNPADQVAETPNLQLFSNSSGTQGYLMEVDSTSTAAGSTANYPRMFHSVFNMNGTGTVTGKRVMPASLEVYNNSTGTITWSSSAEVYAENISNGNWSTMLGIGSRLFNDGVGTVGRMVGFCTSETDHFQNGNYGGGTVTYYAAFEGNGVNANGTYGAVYGLRLLDQSTATVTGNNHAINYNDTFVVKSTGYIYNAVNSSAIANFSGSDYAAPVLAGAGAGNVSNGTHTYKFTLENNAGTVHTTATTATAAVTVVNNAVNGQVTVTVPAQCFGYEAASYVRVYRDKNSDGIYKLVGTATGCTRTFTDNVADGSLGAVLPTTNNTEAPILLFVDGAVGTPNPVAENNYNHRIRLYNPPNASATSEFLYYYIVPQDRLTTTTPHMGIALFGNQNEATATVGMDSTEGGHLLLQGGAESTGGYASLVGGAAFSGAGGFDATEGGSVTCYGATATDAGRIEIISGVAFASVTNLNGGNVTIQSGAPANAGHYGDLLVSLFRNVTVTASSGLMTLTGSTGISLASDTTLSAGKVLKFTGSGSGVVTMSVAAAAGTHTIKLPTADGSTGHFLKTDGAGQWAFQAITTAGLTVGTSTISGGVSGRVLYDNGGVLGEMTNTGTGTVNVLQTAPTLTGPVIINEAVGSSALTLTGATQTSSFPVLDMAQTWNNAGTTFTAAKLNVTSTNSAAASLLLDLQLATVSQFSVDKSGLASVISTGGYALSTDVFLRRDAANILAQRNGTNAQTFNVYNTFTDASNYERLQLEWASNVGKIWIKSAGSGALRSLVIAHSDGNSCLTLPAAGSGSGTTLCNTGTFLSAGSRLRIGGNQTVNPTSGTHNTLQVDENANPTSTSTMIHRSLLLAPTINYSAGTPGAGNYEALRIMATETALPTGTNYLVRASAGAAGSTDKFTVTNAGLTTVAGSVIANSATGIPAGGTAATGLMFSSTANYGIFFGSGAPTLSAAKGSLYLRSDGSGTTNRAYVNTDGGTTWTAITTAA